jgi:hypothetical protein
MVESGKWEAEAESDVVGFKRLLHDYERDSLSKSAQRHSHIPDELSYLYQARILASNLVEQPAVLKRLLSMGSHRS